MLGMSSLHSSRSRVRRSQVRQGFMAMNLDTGTEALICGTFVSMRQNQKAGTDRQPYKIGISREPPRHLCADIETRIPHLSAQKVSRQRL